MVLITNWRDFLSSSIILDKTLWGNKACKSMMLVEFKYFNSCNSLKCNNEESGMQICQLI